MISKKMESALNEQIKWELYSSYLYLAMSAYFQSVDMTGFAQWMRIQAQEELLHAIKFFDYIGERDGRPVLLPIDAPPKEWKSPQAAFENAYKHEQGVTARINNLVTAAEQAKDKAAVVFLQWFVNEQVEEEASVLRRAGVDLVVADIPPAAFPVARRAGCPGIGISNLSWDWIYSEYVRDSPSHAPLVEAIRTAYGQADLLLRLPFHGPCDAFPVVRDIPMVARRARCSPAEARRRLGLTDTRPVVLLSFGGFEMRGIDFSRVERLTDFQFLTNQPLSRPARNVCVTAMDGLRYEDVVAQADAVITKPGYGIVSECLVNRVPVLYTPRGRFAESACLVDGLKRFGVSRFIGNDDLLAGNWQTGLEALLAQPRLWPELPADGARVAAEILRDLMPHAR